MPFDLKEFRKSKLTARTEEVPMSELKQFFDPEENPVFLVRGMTGPEMYQVREAVEKRRNLQAIISKLMGGDGAAIAEAVDEFYGTVPEEFVRRVETLLIGCVSPVLTRQDAMKLFRHFPTQATVITTRILWLTGEGSLPGELKDSGEIPESDTTST